MTLGCELTATALVLTLEGLFSRVYAHMSLQVPIFRKAFAADITLKWLLASMGPLVNLEAS